jgi:hypothetical protein
VELILRAYGSDATWNDVLRIAIVRLIDLAEISTEKTAELGKPRPRDEAEMYERDAQSLRTVRDADG